MKNRFSTLFNWLNSAGALLLAYALANPAAVTDVLAMLPPGSRKFAPFAAVAWFGIVQIAKARAIKKAVVADRKTQP